MESEQIEIIEISSSTWQADALTVVLYLQFVHVGHQLFPVRGDSTKLARC